VPSVLSTESLDEVASLLPFGFSYTGARIDDGLCAHNKHVQDLFQLAGARNRIRFIGGVSSANSNGSVQSSAAIHSCRGSS